MGQDFYEREPEARELFDRISEATGRDLKQICFELDEAELRKTENAQLALYTVGLVAFASLHRAKPSVEKALFAGHSVGEYAALTCAGWLDVAEGAKIVAKRGELMGKAGEKRPGSMAAVLGLEISEVERACDEAANGGVCVVANDNCPGQVVISGDFDAMQKACALCSEFGAKRVMPLNVSGAFHSPAIAEASAEFAETLASAKFNEGGEPVYSNVTAKPETEWARLLSEQLMSRVRWREIVSNMAAHGAQVMIECGTGEVLCGLARRIAPDLQGIKVVDVATRDGALETLEEVGY